MKQWPVATPLGDARLTADLPRNKAKSLLVLGHGAGGGIEARDLAALPRELPAAGIAVIRVEQPWRVAGKRIAPARYIEPAGRPAVGLVYPPLVARIGLPGASERR